MPMHLLLYVFLVQVQSIVRLVVRRSARTAAALLVAVLRLQGWLDAPRRLVVAVDGGVIIKYHNWRKFLDVYLREAFGERRQGAREAAVCDIGWGVAVIAARHLLM